MGRVKGRKITRNWNGTYGVWLCGMVPISIDIVNDPKACVFALFASCMQYSAALHCTAGQITIDPKARHHTVRAAFLSMMLADVAVAVVLLVIFVGVAVLKK